MQSARSHIRPSTPQDVPAILNLIKLLAEYEKLSHEVSATENDIKQNLFGESPKAECILCEADEKVVGFALYFHNFSTFLGKPGIYLEDLFVLPEFRGHGYGKNLLVELAVIAEKRGCGRLEWAVLDWNQSAIDFYKSLGAVAMDSWIINRLKSDEIKKLASLKTL